MGFCRFFVMWWGFSVVLLLLAFMIGFHDERLRDSLPWILLFGAVAAGIWCWAVPSPDDEEHE